MERLPKREGETGQEWNRRGRLYASLKRVQQNKEFFEKVWKLQPKCMAVFGRSIESTFLKLHKARGTIEISAEMLADRIDESIHDGESARDEDESTRKLYRKLRRNLLDLRKHGAEEDSVDKLLKEFELELEAMAKPIIDNKYR